MKGKAASSEKFLRQLKIFPILHQQDVSGFGDGEGVGINK